MIHFETIWNQAESLSKSFTDLSRKDILRHLRNSIDDISDSESIADYNESIGDAIFYLCAMCAHLEEKKDIVVNSAAALTQSISKKRDKINTCKNDKEYYNINNINNIDK